MAYSQRDSAWANTILGFDSSDQNSNDYGTIGMYGCYVTAIANLCQWAGNDLNPVQINDICRQNGWFVNGDEIVRDDIPALLCSNLGYVGRTNWSGPTDINFFDDASDPNVVYIIEIDASPAPRIQKHFTMVWSKPDANDLEIDDSWDGVRKALSHYGTPSVIIQSAMKFIKVAPPSPVPPIFSTPEQIPTKSIQLARPSKLWNLSLPTTTDIDNNPIQEYPASYQETVSAIAHRTDGTNYYLVLPDSTSGFNVLDCENYIPVSPPSPATISAPVTASSTEQYSLVTTIPCYPSPGNALNRTNSNGTLPNGAYYIYNQQQGMYSLTRDLGVPKGTWVNPADNVIAPPRPVATNDTTADVQKSWKWFFANHEPVEYKMLQDLVVKDIVHAGPPIQVHRGRTIDIYGSFEKDGKTYLRPFTASDSQTRYYFYGIPTTDIYSGAPYMDNEYNIVDIFAARWESFYDKAIKTIDGIFRPKRKK